MSIVEEISKLWWHNGHLNEDQRDFLIEMLQNHKPRYCIETGFATGRSTVTTLIAAQPERLVSVDISLDYMGARSHANSLLEKFSNLRIVEGDSYNMLNSAFFNEFFPEGIDFAFIDGSHTYIGALSDIEKVFDRMNSGAIMLVDDYMSGPPNGCPIPDVDRAVHDFANSRSLQVERWSSGGKGVAIMRKA